VGAPGAEKCGAAGAPAVCLALRGKRKIVARLPFPNTRRAAYAVRVSVGARTVFTPTGMRWTEGLVTDSPDREPARPAERTVVADFLRDMHEMGVAHVARLQSTRSGRRP
jgi:hypothetical protein